MKKSLLALAAIILLLNACKKVSTETQTVSVDNPEVIPSAKINNFIKQQIEANNKFEWSSASDEMIWSALQQSDNILSVGYKPANEKNVENRLAEISINSSWWRAAKNEVINIILTSEGKTRKNLTAAKLFF